jgi:integrase
MGSDKITPHTLCHTAATWLMQAGVDRWEAASFLGMSVEMLGRIWAITTQTACIPRRAPPGIVRGEDTSAAATISTDH